MKKRKNWPLLAAALVMMALNRADHNADAMRDLQPQNLVPVILITAAVFLVKIGALAAVLSLLRKLWNRIKRP